MHFIGVILFLLNILGYFLLYLISTHRNFFCFCFVFDLMDDINERGRSCDISTFPKSINLEVQSGCKISDHFLPMKQSVDLRAGGPVDRASQQLLCLSLFCLSKTIYRPMIIMKALLY